ncbi:helix-turn-helix transcriptional regulator [uncultured Jannaschia sp.]|uniref:helix-turn-helix domain-containing protein n=1 Tax=uncultured Jannaschia sp. TaxID=293347 RepID=UPI0026055632|nr:helix-turn-helix transcriptional regulator [uncultured Jannaschia sp.]
MERSNPDLIAAFAAVLRRRRKAVGLSQEEFAFRSGLSPSYVSYLETKRRQPTLSVLAAICDQLDISMTEFVADVEESRVGLGKSS